MLHALMPDFRSFAIVLLRRFAVAMFILLAAAAADAAEHSASGQFSGSKLKFNIEDAYGFWAKGGVGGDDPVIRVAVSNSGLDAEFFDGWYDRQYAIGQFIVDDENKVVYFDFNADGKYRGLSYYFGSGDGCGYCYDSKVRSTVRVEGGRLKGKLAFTASDDPVAFDIDFDVAVPSKVWGDALPRDGGDPGRAYLAYHKAIAAQDPKAVAAAVDAHGKEGIAKFQKQGKLKGFLEYRWDDVHHGMKNVSIVGGFVRGDRAIVLYDGSSTIERMHGEAKMRREGGVWLFNNELLQVGSR
jgi:hypothetical protein